MSIEVHYIANGMECSCCGKIEFPFVNKICDCHTHGLSEYGSLELQIVLDLGMYNLKCIMSHLVDLVISGRKFTDGYELKDESPFEDCSVKFLETKDCDGNPILRVIFPDSNNLYPDNSKCVGVYKYQFLPYEDLLRKDYAPCFKGKRVE